MNSFNPEAIFKFLKQLKKNNNREWMQDHRTKYLENEKILKTFYSKLEERLNETDKIAKVKIFRINRDLRFSPNKTPYNVHRSVSFSRAGAQRRGGYYLRLEPGNTYVAGGFFKPAPEDLLRIRKEFEFDSSEIKRIFNDSEFKQSFEGFNTDSAVKTAPRGFDKYHENIELIRLKKYIVKHSFTDAEVFTEDFQDKVLHHFNTLRPFFDYMSSVLTTNLNGESIIDN